MCVCVYVAWAMIYATAWYIVREREQAEGSFSDLPGSMAVARLSLGPGPVLLDSVSHGTHLSVTLVRLS